jgi:hypothetical protein
MRRKRIARILAVLLVVAIRADTLSASWLSFLLHGERNSLADALRANKDLVIICATRAWGVCGQGDRYPCPSGCVRGHPYRNPDGSCKYWYPDDRNNECGKTISVDTPEGIMTSCIYAAECKASKSGLSIGYDALPAIITPANVVSVSPQPRRVLSPQQSIHVKFSQTMDATSVKLSSEMRTEAGSYAFSRSSDQFIFNDTLSIPPATAWSPGPRILTIDLKNESANPSRVQAVWFVLAPGQSASPDFSTCTEGCGQRWFEKYQVEFSASGGFAPFTWRVAPGSPPGRGPFEFDTAPGHDSAKFTSDGVFEGGPTNCFLCRFYFTVCVKDQTESETCHPVSWDSGL